MKRFLAHQERIATADQAASYPISTRHSFPGKAAEALSLPLTTSGIEVRRRIVGVLV